VKIPKLPDNRTFKMAKLAKRITERNVDRRKQ